MGMEIRKLAIGSIFTKYTNCGRHLRKEKKLSRQVYLDIVRTPYASQTCTSFNSMLTIDNYSNILQNNRIKQKTNNLLDKRKLFIEHFS